MAASKAVDGRDAKLEIFIPSGERLGDQVIEIDHLVKGYGQRLLIEDLSFSLPKAGIVGVIGGNGVGKSTLFRMLTSQEAPDAGQVRIGSTVQLAYVDQSRDTLDAEATVYDEITGGRDDLVIGGREMHGRAYVASFNFKGSDQQKKVGVSGGGATGCTAKVPGGWQPLLDEPTNDLDVDTLRAGGQPRGLCRCAVVISRPLVRSGGHPSRPSRAIPRFVGSRPVEYEARRQGARSRSRSAPPCAVQATLSGRRRTGRVLHQASGWR
ncbi:MAG: ATP-binding cassette domain-containing protein [Acidimicrobiales bacterium]